MLFAVSKAFIKLVKRISVLQKKIIMMIEDFGGEKRKTFFEMSADDDATINHSCAYDVLIHQHIKHVYKC